MSADPEHKSLPYASYKSFTNFLDHLKASPPLPSRIDKSAMHSANYGTQQALLGAIRSLGLVGGDDKPTLRLAELVTSSGEMRAATLKEMAEKTYPFFWDGSTELARITADQFDEKIKAEGKVTGSTVAKAGAFFIALASEAGITLSPHLTKRRAPSSSGTRRPGAKRSRSQEEENESEPLPQAVIASDFKSQLLEKFPTFDPAWPDGIKTKWFEGFERLMGSVEKDGQK